FRLDHTGGNNQRQAMHNLHSMLLTAQGLEVLDIAFTRLAPFSDVVGKTTWPQLKRVSFRFLAASDKDLMCFFKEHKSCLKHLCLADIDVTGSWTDILNLLQSSVDLDNCSLLNPLGDWTYT